MIRMSSLTKQKQTDLENELMVIRGKNGEEKQGVLDQHVHTAIFEMDNQQSPTAQYRELCLIVCCHYYLIHCLDERRVWGRMDTCIYMTESLCCPPETITTLLFDYNVLMVNNPLDIKRHGFNPQVRKKHWSRKWQLAPVFSPGKFRGQRSLAGYSSWATESQT